MCGKTFGRYRRFLRPQFINNFSKLAKHGICYRTYSSIRTRFFPPPPSPRALRQVIRRARRIKGSAPVFSPSHEASASPAEPVRRERFLIYINVRAAPSGRSPILFRAGSDWPRHLSICLIRIYCLTLQSRIRACGVIGSRVRLRI